MTTATQLAADRLQLQDYRKISKSTKDYDLLKHEEYFCGWMEKFEEQASLHKLDSLINSKFDSTDNHRQSLKAGSNERILFEEQALFLFAVFRHILKTVKGKELVQRNKKDPIMVWKELLHHHKGSDASMDAAMKLLQRLFQLNASKFKTWKQ